jgi:hypothetical protein
MSMPIFDIRMESAAEGELNSIFLIGTTEVVPFPILKQSF